MGDGDVGVLQLSVVPAQLTPEQCECTADLICLPGEFKPASTHTGRARINKGKPARINTTRRVPMGDVTAFNKRASLNSEPTPLLKRTTRAATQEATVQVIAMCVRCVCVCAVCVCGVCPNHDPNPQPQL